MQDGEREEGEPREEEGKEEEGGGKGGERKKEKDEKKEEKGRGVRWGWGGARHQGAKARLWEPSRESAQLQPGPTHSAEPREDVPGP